MIVLLTLLHIVVAVFLIMVVLLQTGKGAEMGASFGGASNTVFGSSGPANFLAKLTTAAAVIFMVTSLSLAYIGMRRASSSGPAPGGAAQIPADGHNHEIPPRGETAAGESADSPPSGGPAVPAAPAAP
jgi:preprotein translocase subunit SecG